MASRDPATATDPDERPDAGEAPPRFKDRLKRFAHGALDPVVNLLVATGARPDQVTVLGLLLSVAAALAFFEGMFRLGSLLLILSGICDILDGQIARRDGMSTRFGAFLDSTLDRLADALVLAGIGGFYIIHLVELVIDPPRAVMEITRDLEPVVWARIAMIAVLALIGSFMVSYTRARAEGLGLDCKVGWFERPERMVLLIVAGLFGVGPVMPAALIILALLSSATAIQRVAHVWKITRTAGMDR
ncbi:MAG: CDP-alcohol phosphatidyltransferase family protein [Candidatus Eisenbacteria bacterium]|uniref:CDP-alcohol phosphatidyltransferase family protein n=1 Tax=Eiseniibacteriota bacterium TaxID=2212470 RepID=A0A849SKM5_UNCEI|nr:CDP-alcohol phosphatidyltransferase family protein [Candidatus Eisenbacteria bacterium]